MEEKLLFLSYWSFIVISFFLCSFVNQDIYLFVSNQCDKYIFHAFNNKVNTKETNLQLNAVVELVHKVITSLILSLENIRSL